MIQYFELHIYSTYVKLLEGLDALMTMFLVKFGMGIKIAFVNSRLVGAGRHRRDQERQGEE